MACSVSTTFMHNNTRPSSKQIQREPFASLSSAIFPAGRFAPAAGLVAGAELKAVQANHLRVAAAADEHGLPIGRDRIFVVGEFADVAAADGGGSAGGRVAAGVVDLCLIDEIADDARGPQALKIALRRELVVADVDLFAGLPGSAAGRLVEDKALGHPVERADQGLRIVGQRVESQLPATNHVASFLRSV